MDTCHADVPLKDPKSRPSPKGLPVKRNPKPKAEKVAPAAKKPPAGKPPAKKPTKRAAPVPGQKDDYKPGDLILAAEVVDATEVRQKAIKLQAARATKGDTVKSMISRPEGATMAQIMAATGWLAHSTRAFISQLPKKGFAVTSAKEGDPPVRVYRGAQAEPEAI